MKKKYQYAGMVLQDQTPTPNVAGAVNPYMPSNAVQPAWQLRNSYEIGQPNYQWIAASNAVQGIMAFARNKRKEKEFQDYDFAQQNPLLQIPFSPNTTDASLYGQQLLKKGGPSKGKACEMLHDGKVHGKKITDKQRKYFGGRCSGSFQEGGMIDEEIESEIFQDPIVTTEIPQQEQIALQGDVAEEDYSDLLNVNTRARTAYEAEEIDPNMFAEATGYSAPTDIESFKRGISAVESGGDYFAKNPKSSAFGKYQFLKGTREGVRKQFFPHLRHDEFENLYKTSPTFQEEVMNAYSGHLLGKYKDPRVATQAFYLGEGNAYKKFPKGHKPTPNNMAVDKYLSKAGYKQGGTYYLTDEQIETLKSQGYDLEIE